LDPAARAALYLADHLHAVAIDDDLVLLDVAADAYFCWIGAAAVIAVTNRRQVSTSAPEAEAALRGAGFIAGSQHDGPDDRSVRRLPPVLSSLDPLIDQGRFKIAAMLTTLAIARRAEKDFRRNSFAELVHWAADRPLDERRRFDPPTLALRQVAEDFAYQRLWTPFDGPCLKRSYMMLRYLRAKGHDAAIHGALLAAGWRCGDRRRC